MNPIRKSCWEIKSLHPSAPSGEYRIQGPDGQPVNVLCDMIGEGGGWTLAAVALFGNHGQAGLIVVQVKLNFEAGTQSFVRLE
jgi:hypothetical protein